MGTGLFTDTELPLCASLLLPVLLSLLHLDRVSFALTAAGAVVACAVLEPVSVTDLVAKLVATLLAKLVTDLVPGGLTALVLKLLLNPIAGLRAELVT
ncbi:MAG: hypothetical protein H5T84_11035 [Thermoleophilia bacterium]|nr:hypothetical protein [Thermoleophilia bacterium]